LGWQAYTYLCGVNEMFYGLKESWEEMLKKASYIADDNGIHISFPQHLFDKVEQEFNLCFVDEEEDIHFKLWQNEAYDDEDTQ
jgi:DNA-binding transcriptional regulator/RsmH inhibitor MraZ